MTKKVLETRGLTKRFGGLTAVNNIDFDVPEGSIVAVIGPNGAGKTSFFNCITGFYLPEDGDVVFKEKDSLVGRSPDQIASLGVARTYQNIRLFKAMTALENVQVGQHPRMRAGILGAILRDSKTRAEEAAVTARSMELLELVGLHKDADTLASNLPYGAQRRLEIARALANEPSLLLLDEPAAGMNPQETLELRDLISRLRSEFGHSILLIEHDMHFVMGISDRVTVLDYGVKISEGTPEHVQNDPKVIEAYLGAPMEQND